MPNVMPEGVPFWFFWETPPPRLRRMTIEEAFNQPPPLPVGLVHIAQVNVVADPNRPGHKILGDLDRQALCGYERPKSACVAQRSYPFESQYECQECCRTYEAWRPANPAPSR